MPSPFLSSEEYDERAHQLYNEGNYDGAYQASTGQLDPNINSAYDYANFLNNARGYLSGDRRHQFKLSASYVFPFRLQVGLNAAFATGAPLSILGWAPNGYRKYLERRGEIDPLAEGHRTVFAEGLHEGFRKGGEFGHCGGS